MTKMGLTLKTNKELESRTNKLMKGKVVKSISVLKENEIVFFFEDGTRLFIDSESNLELSVT